MDARGKKTKIKLLTEVANTDQSRREGLMYRRRLAENSGMIFCFTKDDYHPFWMHNTYIPLDIAFIDKYGKVVDIQSLQPLSRIGIKPKERCRYALEVNRGWFRKNNIGVGSKLQGPFEKTAGAEGYDALLQKPFEQVLMDAFSQGTRVVFRYRFRDTGREHDYETLPTQQPLIKTFNNGELIFVVPCVHSSGDWRRFFLDGVMDYNVVDQNGMIQPTQIELGSPNDAIPIEQELGDEAGEYYEQALQEGSPSGWRRFWEYVNRVLGREGQA